MVGQPADTLCYGMASGSSQDDGKHGSIKSVAVAAQILEALPGSGSPVRLAELSRQLDMPRARIHRYLKTLRELGYVSQEWNGERYWLGRRQWIRSKNAPFRILDYIRFNWADELSAVTR